MLTEALTALAASGGAALVEAMATDAWQGARNGMARLFGRQGPQRQVAVEAQLDGNVGLVEQDSEPDEVRRQLLPVWRMELLRLLKEHPDAEAELRQLISHIRDTLPEHRQVQQNQYVITRDNARSFAVQGGDLIYHDHAPARQQDTANGGADPAR
ncbi:hypothetical protein ACIBIZ_51530 [Nonomuraea spiralis]|uniref:hypothetical protein n=1 Tax=Nonomuraea TaxID=83681 RepID=UPI000F79F6C7|nr:hypothetical protein [Nonomuraea sp. WAC 01424]RSN15611.1 hypothetical protein DMB42_01995 [Nonomuraea sp. WAC 01424]